VVRPLRAGISCVRHQTPPPSSKKSPAKTIYGARGCVGFGHAVLTLLIYTSRARWRPDLEVPVAAPFPRERQSHEEQQGGGPEPRHVDRPEQLIYLRDRALLLVGFAGAFRRSELVALNLEDPRGTSI
jgi:hypothetical protein